MSLCTYGTPHPKAPPELDKFSFLIGVYNCKGRVRDEENQWVDFSAEWVGRYILDGMAIADEFCAHLPDGSLFKHGQNIRMYNTEQKSWRMKWIDAMDATVIKQGTKELGGVKCGDSSISFHIAHESGEILRAKYTNISHDSFHWQGSILNEDGETWDEVMVIEAIRAED